MPDSEPAKPASGSGGEPLKVALRKIPIFADLNEEQLDWFASNCEDVRWASGEVVIHEGDPADVLIVLLEGELRGRRDSAGADSPVYVVHAGTSHRHAAVFATDGFPGYHPGLWAGADGPPSQGPLSSK